MERSLFKEDHLLEGSHFEEDHLWIRASFEMSLLSICSPKRTFSKEAQKCGARSADVGIPGETEPARPRDTTDADVTPGRPEARAPVDPGPPVTRPPICGNQRVNTSPARARTRATGGLRPPKLGRRNAPDSESMSPRFGSYLEVAKRALNRGKNRSFSLC